MLTRIEVLKGNAPLISLGSEKEGGQAVCGKVAKARYLLTQGAALNSKLMSDIQSRDLPLLCLQQFIAFTLPPDEEDASLRTTWDS